MPEPNPTVDQIPTAAESFAGKIAVVTGAGNGIGRATALMLARRGAAVAGIDRDTAGLAATVTTIEAMGRAALAVPAELADAAGIAEAARAVVAWRDRVDVLAHIAGVSLYSHAADITVAQWDLVLDVNLRAPFLLTQALLEPLLAARGAVVAVSSVAGMQGWPYRAAYAASKGGLAILLRSLAVEYGPQGLRCNVVSPSSVETSMAVEGTPLPGADPSIIKRRLGLTGRLAKPDEVAAAICFLASADASFISGAVVPIDGGAFA